MSILQALLLALWAGFCSYDDQGPQMFRRPLLIGPVAGLILGDFHSSLIVSATLELTWMGLGNMAGYQTPDMIIGTIIGIVVTVQTGQGTSPEAIAAGIAAATTVAVLVQQLLLIFGFIKQTFAPWADRLALTGDFDSIMAINYVAVAFQFLVRAVPTFLIAYFSEGIVMSILNVIPSNILSGLSTASGLLPAVGLSILMTMMMKPIFWPFLIFGFVLSTYLKLPILAITMMSLAIAILYDLIMETMQKQKEMPVQNSNVDSDDEGGYDL